MNKTHFKMVSKLVFQEARLNKTDKIFRDLPRCSFDLLALAILLSAHPTHVQCKDLAFFIFRKKNFQEGNIVSEAILK